ncbi:MAG TPA: hypothetical protein VF791_20770 [Pyrinomonadaceae bacterium]
MKNQKMFPRVLALLLLALVAAACGGGNATPTQAYETYYKGMKSRNVAAIKSVLTKSELERMDEGARQSKQSLDEFLGKIVEIGSMDVAETMPELRNEKIAGDGKTATLEVKEPFRADKGSGRWMTFKFYKEDDGWKLHLRGG